MEDYPETIIPPLLGLPLEVLSKYCEEKKKPTFNQFVASNQDKFVQWSIDIAAMKGTTLHGVWFERYRKQLKYEKAKYAKPRKSKYNNLIWNTIMTRVTTRRRLRGDYNEGRLVLLNDASAATTREARRLFENPNNSNSSGDGSNSGPSESTSPNSSEQNNNHDEDGEALDDHEDNDDDDDEQEEYVDNMPLATLAMKKLSNKFKSSDMDTLMNLMKNGDDILSRANNHIIKLISQKHLTEVEEETIK
ncbi:hypothetical protein BDC45DRAFT_157483 [Circinella umbellata]|nr:hypothetical protein BDC45DRAFT_157483 [Circinella umbellata]